MKRALVIGTAQSMPHDLARFALTGLQEFTHEVFIVNEAFRYVARWDHWVSLHPERMVAWRSEAMDQRGWRAMAPIHLPDLDPDDWDQLARKAGGIHFPHQRHAWRVEGATGEQSGSSGLFATRLAIRFGYGRVVLAGVPMDTSPHVLSTAPWTDRERFVAAWSAAERELKGKVRSLSGWTREFLGEPTLHWWSQ